MGEIVTYLIRLQKPAFWHACAILFCILLLLSSFVPDAGGLIYDFSCLNISSAHYEILVMPFSIRWTSQEGLISRIEETFLRIIRLFPRVTAITVQTSYNINPHTLYYCEDTYLGNFKKSIQQSIFLIDLPPPSL